MGMGEIVAETWRGHGSLLGSSGFSGKTQFLTSRSDRGDWTHPGPGQREGGQLAGPEVSLRAEAGGGGLGLCLGTSGCRREHRTGAGRRTR